MFAVTGIEDARRRHHGDLARVPPHDLDAERSLLGALLVGQPSQAGLIGEAVQVCTGADFYKPAHGHVFEAIGSLHAGGEPVDPVTVADELRRAGLVGTLGERPLAELVSLQASTPATSNARRYAEIVVECSRMRQVIEVGHNLAEAGYGRDLQAVEKFLAAGRGEIVAAGTAGAKPSSWEPVALGPVLAGDATGPIPSLLRRSDGRALLYPGKVHAVNAEPEGGKTWLGLASCAERLAAGEHVLYLDFEADAPGLVGRLLELGVEAEVIAELFHYIRPDEALDARAQHAVDSAIETWAPSLAIIDGVAEVLAMNGWRENDAPDVAAFLVALPRRIAQEGAAVLLIDHLVKDKDAQGRYARGSGAKLAGVDVAYKLEMVRPFGRDSAGMARVVVTKDRHGYVRALGKTAVAEFHLTSDGSEVVVELRAPTSEAGGAGDEVSGLRPAAVRVLKALRASDEWLDVGGIGDAVAIDETGLGGLKRRTIQVSCQTLVGRDLAESEGSKGGAHKWRAHPASEEAQNDA